MLSDTEKTTEVVPEEVKKVRGVNENPKGHTDILLAESSSAGTEE